VDIGVPRHPSRGIPRAIRPYGVRCQYERESERFECLFMVRPVFHESFFSGIGWIEADYTNCDSDHSDTSGYSGMALERGNEDIFRGGCDQQLVPSE
tara:strand:- start:1826 stop:2116 length:291 start_codon:yes stop_codon:yes gene_type:complete